MPDAESYRSKLYHIYTDETVMPTWYTSKPCWPTQYSHISHCVFDSTWEMTESYLLERNSNVAAWAKNDHLGFEIVYVFDGVVRKYYPDFLIRLANGKTLVLETKGQKTRRDVEKRKALEEWIAAVNGLGDYGEWCSDVSYNVADVDGIIQKHLGSGYPITFRKTSFSNVKLYVEKYDPQLKNLLLDFINERDFLYYKLHGDVAQEQRMEESTPTMLLFDGIELDAAESVEGMIINTTFEALWDAPDQSTMQDSSLISVRYPAGTAPFILQTLENRREPNINEVKTIFTTWSGAPAALESMKVPLTLTVYTVGQGSWNEICDGNGNYTIFDCGTFVLSSDAERKSLLRTNHGLVKGKAASTSLIISHWDADHYNLLRSVSNIELSRLTSVHCPNQYISLTVQDIAKRLKTYCTQTQAIRSPARKGKRAQLELCYYNSQYGVYIGQQTASLNNSGLAMAVYGYDGAALLTADHTYRQVLEDMLPNVNHNLVTNMVVPHHGGNAGTQITVKIPFPGKAIVSTDGKSHGHPIDSVLDFLHLLGFQVCRTDKNGRPFEVISL